MDQATYDALKKENAELKRELQKQTHQLDKLIVLMGNLVACSFRGFGVLEGVAVAVAEKLDIKLTDVEFNPLIGEMEALADGLQESKSVEEPFQEPEPVRGHSAAKLAAFLGEATVQHLEDLGQEVQ